MRHNGNANCSGGGGSDVAASSSSRNVRQLDPMAEEGGEAA